MNSNKMKEISKQFLFPGEFKSIEPYGDGHINDTYLVTHVDSYDEVIHFILQRVNHEIFTRTKELMINIENVTSYLEDMITEEENDEGYEILKLIHTKDGQSYYVDEKNFWRAFVFVEGATGHTFVEKNSMLYEGGFAFGKFQKMLKDYPVDSLYETIVGFHNTLSRYETFKKTMEKDSKDRVKDCKEEVEFVLEREDLAGMILQGIARKEIPLRVTHNDTKLNNVLLDDITGRGRCVIDLDTVMPGSALYDFGDAIRSCGSTVAEDEEDLSLLDFDMNRFEAYTKGYLEALGDELTPLEKELLPEAAIIMTLECGVRFLTDYLDGDKYFKIHKEKHNLIRAKNQFKFVLEMEKHMDLMREIVKKYDQ